MEEKAVTLGEKDMAVEDDKEVVVELKVVKEMAMEKELAVGEKEVKEMDLEQKVITVEEEVN